MDSCRSSAGEASSAQDCCVALNFFEEPLQSVVVFEGLSVDGGNLDELRSKSIRLTQARPVSLAALPKCRSGPYPTRGGWARALLLSFTYGLSEASCYWSTARSGAECTTATSVPYSMALNILVQLTIEQAATNQESRRMCLRCLLQNPCQASIYHVRG